MPPRVIYDGPHGSLHVRGTSLNRGQATDVDDHAAARLEGVAGVHIIGDSAPADHGDSDVGKTGPSTAEVRAWAKENDYKVTARGKIADEVYEAYRAAHAEPVEDDDAGQGDGDSSGDGQTGNEPGDGDKGDG